MLRFIRSAVTGRRLVAASVVAAATSLAACGDAATAPKAPTLAPAAESQSGISLNLGAYLEVRMADTTGTTLTERAWAWFYSGKDTLKIRDNAAGDLDPAVGFIKVMMSKTNNYKVEGGRSEHYMPDLDGTVNWKYIATSTSAAMTVNMGTLVLERSPMFKIFAKDEFGAAAGGATYQISTPINGWSLTFQDGIASYDESLGADGITIYTINFPFSVKICEVKPPSKMVLTSPACFTLDAKWGGTYTHTFTHEHAIY
jgi:hypothetical protein